MNWVDAVIVVLLIAAAYSGFRRGLITAMLTLVGAIGGALAGTWIAPMLAGPVGDAAAKVAIGVAVIVVGVGAGEVAGQLIGSRITRHIRWRPAVAVDRGLGLVGHAAAVLAVAWLVAVPLAAVPVPWLSSQIRTSTVLAHVDTAMPDSAVEVSGRIRDVFVGPDFPQILGPLAPAPDVPTEAPDPSLTDNPRIAADLASVLKVRAIAPSCSRSMEGSGFVVAPGVLVTNAHVVAGADSVTVQSAGRLLPATVVRYDPDVDLAVLDVAALDAPAMRIDTDPVDAGTSVAAVGYPLDGPLAVTPLRVRSTVPLRGPNIYDSRTVTREVYSLRGSVRPGNSGGPLVAADGSVVGVVFGAAIDNPDVGFALTADEVMPVIRAGEQAQAAVGTGACTAE